jgi:glycosyltransferase EpsF
VIKVLEIVGTLHMGGVEKLVLNLSKCIDRQKFDLEILVATGYKGEFIDPIRRLGVPIHYFGDYQRKPYLVFLRYFSLLRKRQYNVVHCHLNYWAGPFLFLAYLAGTGKRICHFHNTFDEKKRIWPFNVLYPPFRMLVKLFATNIIGVSGAALDSVFGQSWRKNKKTLRVYNGIDLEQFGKRMEISGVKLELGIPESVLVLGHVGRFRDQKNQAFLIEIAKILRERSKNFVFVLVGDGPTMPRIREEVSRNNLEKHFIFLGAREDVAKCMRAMDVFVFPSLWEGFGLVVIEAQAAGLPVIVSDAIPMELPLIAPSVRLPLQRPDEWVDVIGKMTDELIRGGGGEKAGLSKIHRQLNEFSIQYWISRLETIYQS